MNVINNIAPALYSIYYEAYRYNKVVKKPNVRKYSIIEINIQNCFSERFTYLCEQLASTKELFMNFHLSLL